MRATNCSFIVASVETVNPRERLLAVVPATTGMLEIEGCCYGVVEVGDGSLLLLLAGGIECCGAMWARVLSQLAETKGVVVPDVPGLGESAPVGRLDVDTFTGWTGGVARLPIRGRLTAGIN
jgi:hypothetical protein